MKTKRTFAMLLTCAIVFATAFGCILPEKAYAATVKMNKTSVTLYLDDESAKSVNLKVLNGSGKASWSSNLSKVVSVKSTGNRAAKVTALKPGRVTVTAKIGKKSYKCTVTVLRADDDYNAFVNKAAKAVVTCKYKTLMELAPKEELLKWIDSLGETVRRKAIVSKASYWAERKQYWKSAEKFYLATVGADYATTLEAANQAYAFTTGVCDPKAQIAKNSNYRVISEKNYKSVYGESKFENLKSIYAKALGMELQEAKIIKCSYKCSFTGCNTLHSKTFTVVKSGDEWYFAPYSGTEITKWTKEAENLTPADTLYLKADEYEVSLKEYPVVTITVEPGDYVGDYDIIYDTTESYDVGCEWGEWIDDNKIELYIYATGKGIGGIIQIRNSVNDDVIAISVYY